ncbi:MAG: glycoside hydrolase [Clostridiales bacterium]|nr:glycoside hydrolase [Clostridiales bacterium]
MSNTEFSIVSPAKTIISNPDSVHNYFAWPSITKTESGALAAVCSGYRTEHVDPFGKAVMSLSRDGGESWCPAYPVIDTPLDDRDAGILCLGNDTLLVTSFNNTRQMQRDNNKLLDSLARWMYKRNKFYHSYLDLVDDESEKKYLGSHFRFSFDGGVTFGPLYRSPVTSPHGPCLLSDGTILWVGTEFVGTSMSVGNTIAAYEINTDGTVKLRGTIDVPCSPEYCEPHVALLGNRLICHIRVCGDGCFYIAQSVSDDGGYSWSEVVPLLDKEGGSPPHLLVLSDGTLLCTYGYRKEPYGIRFMVSRDGGESWDTDNVLYSAGKSWDIGYPCTVELKDGTLITVFYERETVKRIAHDVETGPSVIKQIKWKLN